MTDPSIAGGALLDDVDRAEERQRAQPVDLGAAALFYVERLGWPVLPLAPGAKTPLTRHGFKDASSDPKIIRRWWWDTPDANIGTPTGVDGCGLDVLDVDGPAGFASLAELRHALCPADCCRQYGGRQDCHPTGLLPPQVARSCTPRGQHLFSVASGATNAVSSLPGLDVRGDGGYVVLPPSVGADGRRYDWALRPPLPQVGL